MSGNKKVEIKKDLSDLEVHIIRDKGTERPFTGLYTDQFESGTYLCRNCGAELYRSTDKFHSGCGWPSFDDEISGAVHRSPDPDGQRVEITCNSCGGHLGHVFTGERMTDKNVRHCVNSASLEFRPATQKTETAVLASGCFWGTEYFLSRLPGVLQTRVGYSGGTVANPTYEQVCAGTTGHLECVEVVFNPEKTSYLEIVRKFFETHDFSQENGQGPDIGSQYLSGIFVRSEEQRQIAVSVIEELEGMGRKVATRVLDKAEFYPGEDYHQKYYFKKAQTPYCHVFRPIWPEK